SEAAAPAPPPPKPRLPRPGAVPRANVPPARPTLRAEPAPPARPPAPPREVAESLTDAADLLDELEAEPAPQLFPGGSPFAPTPAQAQGAPPEPAPGASGILPRFAMPSETDASSPRIVDLEAAPSAPLEPQAVIGDLPAPSAPP